MQPILRESTPVQYNSAAIKVLHFEMEPHTVCFRLHWHDRMELVRVKSGSLLVEIGSACKRVSAGELLVLPPKTMHKGYTVEEAVEYDVLMFDVRSFYNETEICQTLLPSVFDGRAVLQNFISNTDTIRCMDSICEGMNTDALSIAARVYELLSLLFRHALIELQTQPRHATVRKVVEYLETNFREDIDLTALCETFGYSEAYFCRKFKQATGLTPMAYLKIYRLERARKLLQNTDAAISEIALLCGFSDANYFTRCFKAHFAVRPTQIKRNSV